MKPLCNMDGKSGLERRTGEWRRDERRGGEDLIGCNRLEQNSFYSTMYFPTQLFLLLLFITILKIQYPILSLRVPSPI